MGLKQVCAICEQKTIPFRIKGVYVGSADTLKIWQCRKCGHLWTTPLESMAT